MKKIIRLTESELHSLIANAVKKMVNEASGYIPRDGMTGGAWSYDHDSVQVDIYLDEILNSPSMDRSFIRPSIKLYLQRLFNAILSIVR